MVRSDGETAGGSAEADRPWRDRALERSLRAARARAVSRSGRFLATATEILQETGRADFTVQELVARARTSMRSFYQYFASKDELLLALLEETIADSVERWREEIGGKDALGGLRHLVHRVYGSTGGDPWSRLNRALASYHMGIAQQQPDAYFTAFLPLATVIRELVDKGVDEGVLRSDISPQKLTAVLIETVVGAAVMNALGGPRLRFGEAADPDRLWEFCRCGLVGTSFPATLPRPAAVLSKPTFAPSRRPCH